MKNLFLILFSIICLSTSAQTSRKLSIDLQSFIQSEVDQANPFDTIEIPAGNFIINKTIILKKNISLKGAGIGKTVLSRSEQTPDSVLTLWGDMIRYDINSETYSGIIISDMSLKGKNPDNSKAIDVGIKINRAVGFKILNCRIENFGNAGIYILHDDSIVNGLIRSCEFFRNAKGADGLGYGYGVVIYGTNKKWLDSPRFGTSNFIFIENSYFERHRHAVAAGGGALYVFRYNTVINNLYSHAVDAHEARQTIMGGNFYSTRGFEIYNNSIINTTFKDGQEITPGSTSKNLTECAIKIRGGEGVIYNNSIDGYRFAVGVQNFEASGVQSYPIFTQIGYKSGLIFNDCHLGLDYGKAEGDLFIWGNTFAPYVSTSSSQLFYNYQPEYFKEGRDYHLVQKPKYSPYQYPY